METQIDLKVSKPCASIYLRYGNVTDIGTENNSGDEKPGITKTIYHVKGVLQNEEFQKVCIRCYVSSYARKPCSRYTG